MRFGYWMPVFGGWLRNVADENMEASWPYIKKLAQRSEEIGFDVTLLAELHLNDIKGPEAPSLDAWSTAAALAAVTSHLELMVAVRPTFHLPALLAKQAANIDHISNGRISLNVVSVHGGPTKPANTACNSSSTTIVTPAPANGSLSSMASGIRITFLTAENIIRWTTTSCSPNQSRVRAQPSTPEANPKPPKN